MPADVFGIEMGIGVENQPGEKTQNNEIIPILGFYPGDERVGKNQNRDNRQQATQQVDDVAHHKGIHLSAEQAHKSVNGNHHPDLDGRAHLAVEFPEAEVAVIDVTKLVRCKLKDLRILVTAKMTEVGQTGNSRDDESYAGISRVQRVF